jgi:hypothetical protein
MLLLLLACGKTADPSGCEDLAKAFCTKVFQCNADGGATLFGQNADQCESYYVAQCTAPDSGICQAVIADPSAAEACAQNVANAACGEPITCGGFDAGILCAN